MKIADFSQEKKLGRKGYKTVAGVDEVGRGPLAGPVVACAVCIDNRKALAGLKVRDSKRITFKKREELYRALTGHPGVNWALAWVSEKTIDRINILQATRLAMKRAVSNLERKMDRVTDFLILDGKMTLDLDKPQRSMVRADNKVFSCAAASIIAKVSRDRSMKRYHRKYPGYGFSDHKGYGTRKHIAALAEIGPCRLHRRSFRPVARYS